jgi:ATP citrate (pro-S)-lyase
MSAKAIREATGKDLLNRSLKGTANTSRYAVVNENSNFEDVVNQNPWLKQEVIDVKLKNSLFFSFSLIRLF